MAILNARLPANVEQGAEGGPLFKTTVLESASGDEQRIAEWDHCRGEWDVGYGISSKADLVYVMGFHRAALGRFYSWRFKDWGDFEVTTESFGTGDGSTTQFQLKKTYTMLQIDGMTAAATYVRNIILPITTGIVIKDNGSTVNPTDYDVLTGGIVQFDTAPTNAHALTWTGEFDVPCRFDVDKIGASMQMADFGSIRGIRIVEVLDAA